MPQYTASEFLKMMSKLSKEDLLQIKGIGDVLAQNYLDFVNSPRYYKLIQDFEELEQDPTNGGLQVIIKNVTSTNQTLKDEIICITGTFDLSRSEIKSILQDMGAKVTNAVSSKTTILLAGKNPGSKLDKAKKMNIKIITNLEEIIAPK